MRFSLVRRAPHAARTLAAISVALGLALQSPTEVHAMNPLTEKAASLLALPDDAYFDFSSARQQQLQRALGDLGGARPPPAGTPEATADGPPGLVVLGAPRQVRLGTRRQFPVLVGSVRNGMRDWQVNFQVNLQVLVRHVESGRLQVLSPLVSMRRGQRHLRSGAGEPPSKLQAQSTVSAVSRVDLAERLEGRLPDGRYVVTAVAHDWRSNTLDVRLDGDTVPASSGSAPDAAPEAATAVQHGMDARAQLDTKVELPARVAGAEAARLRLALQLGKEAGIREADPATGAGASEWAANVVLVQLDESPVVLPLRIPVQRADRPGPARYNAVCQVDLRQLAPELQGKYQVYVDLGHAVLGPYPLEVTR